jgi:sucrose-6-phosphate hydrolase SacC (GH32 family)
MKRKTKGITVGLLALVSLFCITAAFVLPVLTATADGITMKSESDSFLLQEQTYEKDEGFVYTATVSFNEGNAAGLVFGGAEGAYYWTFNIDRAENRVKLLYFTQDGDSVQATELITDWYIGNDKMTESEKNLVNPKVATIDQVQLKVILSPEADGVYAEFYADNIKRFGVDSNIELNSLENLPAGVSYAGGALGYNCFHADVTFHDVYTGKNDYSYYTELYRQQYHFSQYAHWNNDPNGLVYYDGYYHLYYQYHPYSNYWSDMYWGHARSTDLVHWELLPICLFPDGEADGWGSGNGYMWSGSAMVYHYGDSAEIDDLEWYPNGNGTGLYAVYTRDGGMQDQVIMSSDDGGITWTKRKAISQTIVTGENSGKMDCRDPKIFPVSTKDGKTVLWGMALTGQGTDNVWFLKSDNLLDWSFAGGFKASAPECPEVQTLTADDGTTHSVMSFAGRNYLVGDFSYNAETGCIVFADLSGKDYATIPLSEMPFQKMEYAKDSYATQCYSIDDATSEYYGKTISVSWFSGEPNDSQTTIESGALATLRKTWNGGGFTIPVEWGLKKCGEGYVLSQTPIVKDSKAFEKREIVEEKDIKIDESSDNVLAAVETHLFELNAVIDNPNGESISFRINVGEEEYTEIGWNQEEGYFVDRTHTSDGGLTMANYQMRYTSGRTDGSTQSFYILSDNGSVEVFCEDFTFPFYVLTFASPYSVQAELSVSGEVRVESLTVNAIPTVWRANEGSTEETVLYLSVDSLQLDRQLTTTRGIMAYASSGQKVAWSIESGEGVVAIEEREQGVSVRSLTTGKAVLKAVCGNAEKRVTVTVTDGNFSSDFTYNADGVISGTWLVSEKGLVGAQPSGDGFLLFEEQGSNFTYTARFDLGEGAAAAIVFRAQRDMSDYLIANYDRNGKIVKLWSPRGELGNVFVGDIDFSDILLSVTAQDREIRVSLNGNEVIAVTLGGDERTEGYFGLNICATQATFLSAYLSVNDYRYDGESSLTVKGNAESAVYGLYNRTLGNVKLSDSFYTVSGREITISSDYFEILPETGSYLFVAERANGTFEFTVRVEAIPKTKLRDLTVEYGVNAIIYVGNNEVAYVTLNGKRLTEGEYSNRNGTLTIEASLLREGENTVEIADGVQVKVTVSPQKESEIGQTKEKSFFQIILEFFQNIFHYIASFFQNIFHYIASFFGEK